MRPVGRWRIPWSQARSSRPRSTPTTTTTWKPACRSMPRMSSSGTSTVRSPWKGRGRPGGLREPDGATPEPPVRQPESDRPRRLRHRRGADHRPDRQQRRATRRTDLSVRGRSDQGDLDHFLIGDTDLMISDTHRPPHPLRGSIRRSWLTSGPVVVAAAPARPVPRDPGTRIPPMGRSPDRGAPAAADPRPGHGSG